MDPTTLLALLMIVLPIVALWKLRDVHHTQKAPNGE